MKEEVEGSKREDMLSTDRGYKVTKTVHIMRDALRYYKEHVGMEQGTFLFIDEFIERAMVPFLFIYMQGVKRGKEITETSIFLTHEEYRGLMGEENIEDGPTGD